MNPKDKLLLKIMDTIISSEGYKYTNLTPELINFIQSKYTKKYNIFHIDGIDFIDQREREKIFLISKEKLVLNSEGEEHKKKLITREREGIQRMI